MDYYYLPKQLFSFSGYQDVNNSTLCANIPGAHDKLSGLIKSIENALNQYHFKSEITNNDERFYEKNTSTFYNLQSDLPLMIKQKQDINVLRKNFLVMLIKILHQRIISLLLSHFHLAYKEDVRI